MSGPFKMKGSAFYGKSPLKHPHRTWKEVYTHDHPAKDIKPPPRLKPMKEPVAKKEKKK